MKKKNKWGKKKHGNCLNFLKPSIGFKLFKFFKTFNFFLFKYKKKYI